MAVGDFARFAFFPGEQIARGRGGHQQRELCLAVSCAYRAELRDELFAGRRLVSDYQVSGHVDLLVQKRLIVLYNVARPARGGRIGAPSAEEPSKTPAGARWVGRPRARAQSPWRWRTG